MKNVLFDANSFILDDSIVCSECTKKKPHGLKFKNRPFQKSFFLIFLKYIKFIKYIYFVCIKISDHVYMSEV